MFVENKIFIAEVFAFHAGKIVVQIAAIEIAIDHILEIKSRESITGTLVQYTAVVLSKFLWQFPLAEFI